MTKHTLLRRLATLTSIATGIIISISYADFVQADDDRADHSVAVRAGASNFDQFTGFSYRLGLGETGEEAQIGLDAGVRATQVGFIGGHAIDDGVAVDASVVGYRQIYRRGPLTMGLGLRLGGWRLATDDMTISDQASTVVGGELSYVATAAMSERFDVRVGMNVPVYMSIAPAVETDTLGNTLTFGMSLDVTDRIEAFADAEAGGVFGYNGDGRKWLAQGLAGVRWRLTERAEPVWPDELHARDDSEHSLGAVTPFLAAGWRTLNLADHVSNGPDFAAGVALFGGHLKLGVAGFSRPGPINADTFTVNTAPGTSYKGEDTITLRSDGSFMGLLVAPVFSVPRASWLSVEFPVIVGQAGFGFYLTDDDRDTPDGRRVSEWEDELQDGRDSSFAMAVDAGVKLKVAIPGKSWLRPYVSGSYLKTFGYDAYASSNYGGPSVAVGVQVGGL